MKTRLITLFIALIICATSYSQTSSSAVTDVISSAISERNYTTVPVTDQQIETILKCGIKAPSAMNAQPWKFTVIRDEASMKEIVSDIKAGSVIIVVSGQVSQTNTTPDFDCGLAAENIFLAAHGLGLGARIYGSPARNINAKKDAYLIPEGYKAIVAIRIGNVEKADATTGASPRKKTEEVVNYKK
jgi:nitroreductase